MSLVHSHSHSGSRRWPRRSVCLTSWSLTIHILMTRHQRPFGDQYLAPTRRLGSNLRPSSLWTTPLPLYKGSQWFISTSFWHKMLHLKKTNQSQKQSKNNHLSWTPSLTPLSLLWMSSYSAVIDLLCRMTSCLCSFLCGPDTRLYSQDWCFVLSVVCSYCSACHRALSFSLFPSVSLKVVVVQLPFPVFVRSQ